MQKQRKEELKSIAVIVLGITALAFFKNTLLLYYVAAITLMLSLAFPSIGKLIYKFWMKLSFVLGLIMPKVILTILFYLVLFPLSLLSKVFKKDDPLMLVNNKASLFIETNRTFTKDDFEKPW